MVIEYKNLIIRNAVNEDCEFLAKWWNDGEVMAHAGFPNGIGISADEIKEKIKTDTDLGRRRLVIQYDNVMIGEMSYHIFDGTEASIGVNICDKNYQNKGLGRVILSLLFNELFNMGVKRIFLDTNLKNKRAQHVYEMLGFKKIRIKEWKSSQGLELAVDYDLVKENFHSFVGYGEL